MKGRLLMLASIFAAFLLMEGGVIWLLERQTRLLRAQASHAALDRRRLHDAQGRVGSLRALVVAAERRQKAAAAAAEAAAHRQAATMTLRDKAQQRAMMDPDFRRQLSILDKDWALRWDGPFFRKLGLTAAQRDQLAGIIAQRMQDKNDARFTSSEQNLIDPLKMQAVTAETQKEDDDQIRSLIGSDGYNQFVLWEGAAPLRGIASQLQQSLSYSAAPLSDEQAQQLVDAFVGTFPPGYYLRNTGMNALAPVNQPRSAPISEAELTAASAILAPAQYAALKALADQQTMAAALQATRSR